MDEDAMETWIREARAGGPAVAASGMALLLSIGVPFGSACLALGLLMAVMLLVGARITFPAPDPGSSDW